ncbi:MAG TPA: LCP family protein [bacterium]|nr:LCP family protein [bacterium]
MAEQHQDLLIQPVPAVPPPPPPVRRSHGWSVVRWFLVALPLVAAGLALGIGAFVVSHAGIYSREESALTSPPAAPRSFTWPFVLDRRVNILLIGVDVTLNNRRQVVNMSRADTLMLVSIDPERDRISALSIPRDTRAFIPGVGTTKINASYAFGGPGLTIKTVEGLLNVPIHYYVKLGPQSFARIIDAIGGVEVDVEKDMKYTDNWAGLRIDLKKGRQLLNGDQADQYIRFRHDAVGDIGRVERQQKVLMALFAKLKDPTTLLSAPTLLRAVAENTHTNLTMTDMITLGMFAVRLSGGDIRTATLPGTFSPLYWEPDQARLTQTLTDLFYGVDPKVLAATGIEVLNGSGIPGLARQTAQRLERLGFRIVRVDTAPAELDATTIIDRAGRPEVTRLLAEILGRSVITREAGTGADITIVVAKDLAATRTSKR